MRRPSAAGLSIVVAAILCVLAVVAAITSAFWVFGEPEYPPGKSWFYDLNTQELFVAPSSSHPPIEAPSGPLPDGSPAGVQAMVLESGADKEVVLLFKYPTQTKDQLEALNSGEIQNGEAMMPPVRLVRAVSGGNWMLETSEEGSKLMNQELKDVGQGKTYSIPQ